MQNLAAQFSRDGYGMLPALACSDQVAAFAQAVDEALGNDEAVRRRDKKQDTNQDKKKRKGYALRSLLDRVPLIAQWASSPAVLQSLTPLFEASSEQPINPAIRPVRSILFDKAPHANWHVGWHQDQAIAVQEKPQGEALTQLERGGYGPWSVKEGLVHVEPPAPILEAIVTIRFHLDTCTQNDGPLRIISGSHALGILTVDQTKQIVSEQTAITCTAKAGDALIMKPLLLHASSRVNDRPAVNSQVDEQITKNGSPPPPHDFRRRVVHIEYAAASLPQPLRWRD